MVFVDRSCQQRGGEKKCERDNGRGNPSARSSYYPRPLSSPGIERTSVKWTAGTHHTKDLSRFVKLGQLFRSTAFLNHSMGLYPDVFQVCGGKRIELHDLIAILRERLHHFWREASLCDGGFTAIVATRIQSYTTDKRKRSVAHRVKRRPRSGANSGGESPPRKLARWQRSPYSFNTRNRKPLPNRDRVPVQVSRSRLQTKHARDARDSHLATVRFRNP